MKYILVVLLVVAVSVQASVFGSVKVAADTNSPEKDYDSILVAFAPKVNPKIALAIFVENGGYGSTIAAPINSLLIEKYINGKISKANLYREKNMLNLSLQEIYNKQIPKSIEFASGTK